MPYRHAAGAGALALGLTLASPAAAQPASLVDRIVVTATRAPEALGAVPMSVSLIGGEDVRETPGQGLDDILQLQPGLVVDQVGPFVAHPTAYNESMRGLPVTETRMLVLMDGVPLNDPFFGYIQWNRIPLDDIERVEIVRGGGSPLWGNSAMGGVIDVITKAPTADALDLDLAGGSYGAYRADAFASWLAGARLALALDAAFQGSDGYQTTPPSWYSYGATTLRSPVYAPTTFDARTFGAKADARPADDLTVSLAARYHDNHQILQTPIGDDAQQTWTWSGEVKKSFGEDASLTATAFHDDSRFSTDNPHLLSFTTEYDSNIHRTPVHDTGGSLIWRQSLTGILEAYMIGADAHAVAGRDEADYFLTDGALAAPTIVGAGKQLFLGGFAQATLAPVRRLEIIGSIREQYYENYDAIDTFPPAVGAIPRSSQTSADPRVDVRYGLDGGFALRGAYYRSFRAPTLDELYRTYADTTAGIYEGNPFLKAETLRGGEIGIDFDRPGLRSQFTAYDTTIANLITQRTLPAADSPTSLGVVCGYDAATYAYLTCTQNINAAAAVARGLEAEVDWQAAPGLAATLAATYTDSHYVDGQRLEGVPKYDVAVRVAYRAPRGWAVEGDIRWVSKTYGDDDPADNLIQNAHLVVDASASWPLGRRLLAYVQIQNLTDTTYIAQNDGGPPVLGTPFEVLGGFRLRLL